MATVAEVKKIEKAIDKLAKDANALARKAKKSDLPTLEARIKSIGAQAEYAGEAVPEALEKIEAEKERAAENK